MIRLGIRVRAADAEIAFARLEPVLAGGAEEVALGEAVEFAVYGEDVPDARLRELAGDTLIAVTREPVDPGWERAWHEHIEPVTVGALTFRPPWIPGDGHRDRARPDLRPRLAPDHTALPRAPAGAASARRSPTGAAAAACSRSPRRSSASRPCTAIEIDPAAVATARENARANDVSVDVTRGDARRGAPYAPTVVANLTLPVLARARDRAPRRTR